jgi:anthranilate phosphoribosyltransferase
LANGDLSEVEITPEQAGLQRFPVERIVGGTPQENGERLAALLGGRGSEADAAVVAINAGALLMTAGKAADLREGVELARDAISTGAADRLLRNFIGATNG